MAFKAGKSGNPGGMTREQREDRNIANRLLLTRKHDDIWLKSYIEAMREGVAPILLDYTHRRLGKPPDSLEVSGPDGESLGLSREDRLEYLDAIVKLKKGDK